MNRINNLLQSKGIRQFAGLFSANVITMPLTIVTSILITRYLGASVYGDYKFLNAIFEVAKVVVIFGLFQAGSRYIILTDDKKKINEILGAELLLSFCIFLVMSVALLIYSTFDSNISEKGLQRYMYLLIPFGWTYIFVQYLDTLLPACNNIRLLSYGRALPKVGYFLTSCMLAVFSSYFSTDKLLWVYIGYISTQLLVFAYIIYKLKLSFRNCISHIRSIFHWNKVYGFNVYLSSVFSIGFASLTNVLISYFGMDNTGVGYYSLAVALTSPLIMIPNTVATTQFRNLRDCDVVPRKVLRVTLLITLITLLATWLIIPVFINVFYGESFRTVIKLNYFVSLGVLLHGVADFYNRFMEAKGQGKAIRNSSFFVAFGIMLFNLILIPLMGEYGAALTRLLSGLIYLVSIYIYYKKYLKSVRVNVR